MGKEKEGRRQYENERFISHLLLYHFYLPLSKNYNT